MDSTVVLGLGSNLGESQAIIRKAVHALEQYISGLRCSSLYETVPMYVIDQGKFINAAVTGAYDGTPYDLLNGIHSIEAEFGRDRALERRWGERLLDIDILLFGDLVINGPNLTIPHILMKERRFALEPLIELLPDILDPGTGFSYAEICAKLPDQGVIKVSS